MIKWLQRRSDDVFRTEFEMEMTKLWLETKTKPLNPKHQGEWFKLIVLSGHHAIDKVTYRQFIMNVKCTTYLHSHKNGKKIIHTMTYYCILNISYARLKEAINFTSINCGIQCRYSD